MKIANKTTSYVHPLLPYPLIAVIDVLLNDIIFSNIWKMFTMFCLHDIPRPSPFDRFCYEIIVDIERPTNNIIGGDSELHVLHGTKLASCSVLVHCEVTEFFREAFVDPVFHV